ncbi:hypothetical protein BV898_18358 [Hypsibius exemplaris]|uniref:HMG box domain-containing protein n=1 Tax=Hypsibius exemplaris TaxID=2072580 RepID=A0A9X6NQ46_HYPEX|nr:hypothetical protein BV898_18358 [Hypsibius exemplaris]
MESWKSSSFHAPFQCPTGIGGEIRKAVEGIVQADKALLRAKLPIKPWQLYVKERANTTTADIPEEGPKRGAAFVRLKREFDNLPKEEQERYGVMSAKKRDELEQRKAKKKVLPKKALSPYNIFVRERFPFCPTDMTAKDYLAALALDFKKLTPKQLAKYVEESRKDQERVKRALGVLRPDPKSKRSPTAYTLFIRDNLRAHSDGGPMREAMVKAGAAWRTAAPEVRIKYETMARDMAPAGQKHPETRTRAPTAYNFYLQELARRRVEGESLADVMKTAGALWKTLDASERERYDHLAKVGKIKFLEEKEKDAAHDVRVT